MRPPTPWLRTRRGEVVDMGLMAPSNLMLEIDACLVTNSYVSASMHFITSISITAALSK